MHPAISSKITLAKEKDRKNRKIEEKEIVVVVFFFLEEKRAMATLLLDYFEEKNAWRRRSICNLAVKFSKNLARSGAYD